MALSPRALASDLNNASTGMWRVGARARDQMKFLILQRERGIQSSLGNCSISHGKRQYFYYQQVA